MKRVPKDFPFGEIEVYKAIDGRMCKHPVWWKQGGGAWGCYRSHARILEECLNAGHQSVLIFEDDATFCENFTEASQRYLEALPQGWSQAYLGGQHLKKPIELADNPLVVRARDINRTHAYAVGGREGMTTIYKWLNETTKWRNRNHVDHHYGRLHWNASSGYYAPAQWLCGQAEGKSDISWKEAGERWWLRGNVSAAVQDFVRTSPAQPNRVSMDFIAIVGPHRSGSSCIAMMCYKLGLNIGDKLGGYESKNGGGGEAIGLAKLCEWAGRFPSPGFTQPHQNIEDRLRKWIQQRVQISKRKLGGVPVGGKYPHLCAMGDQLKSICGEGLKVIHCVRPIEESIDSLKRRSKQSKGWLAASDSQCEAVQRWLHNEKEKFVATLPKESVLHLKYADVLSNPTRAVDDIVKFAGLKPTKQMIRNAIAHVKQRQ
jgi:hypothetical protein